MPCATFPSSSPRLWRRFGPRAGGVYVDGTFGAGGYTRALLERGARVVALDRDPSAIRRRRGAWSPAPAAGFASSRRASAISKRSPSVSASLAVDGVVLDIGVSSMQLDEAARGFSLRFDAPLDMRMGATAAPPPTSCATRTRRRSPTFSSTSARSAPRAASRAPSSPTARPRRYVSTLQLAADDRPRRAGAARRADPSGDAHLPGAAHRGQRRTRRTPAAASSPPSGSLAPGGRLAVVTFHSLEDRIVKQFLAQPLRARPRRLAPAARRAGRGRADLRRSARPADRAGRGGDVRPIRARARPSCASPCGSTRRRGERTSAIEALTQLPARRGRRLMWRLMHAAAIAALIGSAAYVYGVKYRTIYASEQLVKTRHLIAKEQGRDQSPARRIRPSGAPRPAAGAGRREARHAAAGAHPDRHGRRTARGPPEGRLDRPHARIARASGGQRHPAAVAVAGGATPPVR